MNITSKLANVDEQSLAFINEDMSKFTIYDCDTFLKEHSGKHILFLGDSVTAGEGVDLPDRWAYKVYKNFTNKEKCSGFFNIAVPGSSVTDAIDQFYKYIELYGKPDVVFFLITQPSRDIKYIQSQGVITKFNSAFTTNYIKRMYKYFEQYCISNNIILNSFTWDVSMKNKKDILESKFSKIARGVFFNRNEFLEAMDIFAPFKTFNIYHLNELLKHVYATNFSLEAKDKVHPGPAFHDFYASFIYNKYLEDIYVNPRN